MRRAASMTENRVRGSVAAGSDYGSTIGSLNRQQTRRFLTDGCVVESTTHDTYKATVGLCPSCAKMCWRMMKANFCGEEADDDSDTSTVDEQGSTNNMINHWTPGKFAAGGYLIMLFPGGYTGLFPDQFPPNFGGGGQVIPAVEGDQSGIEDDMMQQLGNWIISWVQTPHSSKNTKKIQNSTR
jgi:hypothetical protein